MIKGRKVIVVMPAYNAARTLQRTYDEVMAQGVVDLVIVVDDASRDETVAIARTLPQTQVEVHPSNRGYGANQKTCYRLALAAGADIVIMIHPDYQYTPQLLPAMASLIDSANAGGTSKSSTCSPLSCTLVKTIPTKIRANMKNASTLTRLLTYPEPTSNITRVTKM